MAKVVNKDSPIDTVDEATAETSIAAKAIGRKMRRLRLKRSLGLVEVGQQVGLSASFLSQLENGRAVPTLRNLARLALFFKKDLCYFFSEANEPLFRISRAKDRIRLLVGEKGDPFLIAESMSVLAPDRNIVPCIAELLPGAAEFRPLLFSGLEFVYVLDGPLTLAAESKTELLQTHDSAWIGGNAQRLYRCNEGKPARALIITFAVQP